MRILYLMQYFVPPDGSWSTRSYEFARELLAKNHDVTVITSNGMLPAEYKGLSKTTIVNISGIRCIVIPVAYATGMTFFERVKGYLHFNLSAFKAISEQPADIVFASSAPLTIAIPGIWAKLRHRIPLVFEVRDLWPEMPIAVGALRNPLLKSLARSLEWIAYHASAHVVALSPGMAEGVCQRGISPQCVSVIPNFSDLALFEYTENGGSDIRQRLNLSTEQPLVVYAGSLGLLNDVNYLVDVAHHMRDLFPPARFLVVGSGVNKQEITRRALELGVLHENLWIWNSIPKCQMPDLMAAATVATSLFVPLEPMWKNSANKFFDALAAGTPIAINYGGWQAEIIQETGAGMVMPPDDPERGAQLLAEFIRDSKRLEVASSIAKQLATEHFSRDEAARAFVSVLEQVVDNWAKGS